jgi:molybdate transport system substrate-binding protein
MLRRGDPADVVIMNRQGLAELIAQGRIVPGTDLDLAQTLTGVAVRAGAPKPDMSTVAAFKQTLLRLRSRPISSTSPYMLPPSSLDRKNQKPRDG